MPRRKLDDRNDVQVIFRTTQEIKDKIDSIADSKHITTADYLRDVVSSAIEREENGGNPTDDELRARIVQVLKDEGIIYKKEWLLRGSALP